MSRIKSSYSISVIKIDESRCEYVAIGSRRVEQGVIKLSAHQYDNLGVTLNTLKTVYTDRGEDFRGGGRGNALLLAGMRWALEVGRTYLTGLYAPEIAWSEDDELWLRRRGISMVNGGEIHGLVAQVLAACESRL